MPAVRLLPSDSILQRYVEQGMTHQQIAERIFLDTGNRVSRSSVSAAISRAGLSQPQARYLDTLPWRVRVQHIKEYPARMLRLLGRRNSGGDLTEEEAKRLDSWLAMLKDNHAVVAYAPEAQQGFHYVERRNTDGKVPVRKHTIKLK